MSDQEEYYDYLLKANGIPGSEWQVVSKEDWIKAERSAGFRPPLWSGHPDYMKVCATGGWSSSLGISGMLRLKATASLVPDARQEA